MLHEFNFVQLFILRAPKKEVGFLVTEYINIKKKLKGNQSTLSNYNAYI